MAGFLLFPAAPPLLLSFSSPSRLSHARREHWRRCPVCKTVCAVESVMLIYINRHTAMGGRTAAAANAKMILILLRDVAAMGRKRRRWWAATRTLPPPHVEGGNNGGGSCGEAPCSLLSSLAAAVVAQGRCHGDDGDNGDDDGNDAIHSDGG